MIGLLFMNENVGGLYKIMATNTYSGLKVTWGATHRDSKGNLITRQTSIEPPEAPKCLRLSCLFKYIKETIFYVLVANYHARRVTFAEANRHKKILERYRTGEPSPQTIWQGIHANIKLTCPICRKYDIDPFLSRRL